MSLFDDDFIGGQDDPMSIWYMDDPEYPSVSSQSEHNSTLSNFNNYDGEKSEDDSNSIDLSSVPVRVRYNNKFDLDDALFQELIDSGEINENKLRKEKDGSYTLKVSPEEYEKISRLFSDRKKEFEERTKSTQKNSSEENAAEDKHLSKTKVNKSDSESDSRGADCNKTSDSPQMNANCERKQIYSECIAFLKKAGIFFGVVSGLVLLFFSCIIFI